MDGRKWEFDRNRNKSYYFDRSNNTYVYVDGEIVLGPSQHDCHTGDEVTQTISNISSNSSRGRGSSGASSDLSDFSGLSINDNSTETNNSYSYVQSYDISASDQRTNPGWGYAGSGHDQTIAPHGHGYAYGGYASQPQQGSQDYNLYRTAVFQAPTSYNYQSGYVNSDPAQLQSRNQFGTVQPSDKELFQQVGLNVLRNPTRQSMPQSLSTDLSGTPQRILRAARTNGTSNTLNPSFQVRYPGYLFFRRGVVFRVLWPELAGKLNPSITAATNTTIMGEEIYYKIRWFVVVREGQNCCSCLSIQTYGGKGVEKKPKQHHAIMYTGINEPKPLDSERAIDEPPMGPSIRVIPSKNYNKMDPKSRVNFLKVYNVEHNIKVEEFGRVASEDEWKLTSQFNSHWGIPTSEALPPAIHSKYYDGHTYGPAPPAHETSYLEPTSNPSSPTNYNSSMPPIDENAAPGRQAQNHAPLPQGSPGSTTRHPRPPSMNHYSTPENTNYYPTNESNNPYDTPTRPPHYGRSNSWSDRNQENYQYDQRRRQ